MVDRYGGKGKANISIATFHSTDIFCNKYNREILCPYTNRKRTPVPVFTVLPNIYAKSDVF